MAVVDAHGEILNTYPCTLPLSADAPSVPWAVPLTDEAGAYRLLAFDLDAKLDPAASTPAADCAALSDLLDQIGIAHVVCQSGPDGGRHVWVALADPLPAELVRDLASLARLALPSLDITPLANPATGCVRPPGAPHRHGGHSHVLTGDPAHLASGTTTPAQIDTLVRLLAALVPATPPVAEALTGPAPIDDTGRPYRPGRRRHLSPATQHLLDTPILPGQDASRVLRSILLGCIHARWRYADLLPLLRSPGLEALHTHGQGPGKPRAPRKERPQARLAYEWDRAVTWALAHPTTTTRDEAGNDDFPWREALVREHVEDTQARADAAPGLWATGAGPSQRRVLDALCLLHLHAVQPEVEADIRRLARHTGLGRTTVANCLHALAAAGWIHRTRIADGPHGAAWTIDPTGVIHKRLETARTQGALAPRRTVTPLLRQAWITRLEHRLSCAAHDVFTPRGLGIALGNFYARLREATEPPVPLPGIALPHLTAHTPTDATHHARALTQHGLLTLSPEGYRLVDQDLRDQLATELDVTGTLETRWTRYQRERDVWAWWQAEIAWLSAPGRKPRRASYTQVTLPLGPDYQAWPAYPRHRGRRDHAAAAAAVQAGIVPIRAA